MEKDKPIPWTVDLLENATHWQLQGGKKACLTIALQSTVKNTVIM